MAGVVVCVLAHYFDNLCLNPAKLYNLSVQLLLKRTKINKKRPEFGHLQRYISNYL